MKQVLVVCSLLLMTTANGIAQDYATFIHQADSLYKAKDYHNSLKVFEQGFKLEQDNYLDLYYAARAAAMAGEKKKALDLLDLAVQKGLKNINHIKLNPDLQTLHVEPQWQAILNQLQKQPGYREPTNDISLQTELLQILETDQKYRMQIDSVQKTYGRNSSQMKQLLQLMHQQDSLNLIKVKAILDKQGWVGANRIGSQANSALFLVIQHADLATQVKYLPMLREAVKRGDAQASALAYLEDRVALAQGKKQLYGSQIGQDERTGKMYVLPLEDPDNVDKRRQSVGLPPMSEYVKIFGSTWNLEEYKKQQSKNKTK